MSQAKRGECRSPDGHEGLREALYLSQLERKRTAGWLQLDVARYLIRERQLDSAELCLDATIQQSLDKKPLLIALLIGKAELAGSRKQFPRARGYLEKASSLATETADKRSQAIACAKQGDLLAAQEDWPSALEKYQCAAAFHASADDCDGEATALLGAALMAFRLFEFPASLEHYRAAAACASEDPALRMRAGLGEIHALTALSQWSDALELCRDVEEEIRNLPGPERVKDELLQVVRAKKAVNLSLLGDEQQAHEIKLGQLALSGTSERRAVAAAELAEAEFSRGNPAEARRYEQESEFFRRGLDADLPSALLPLSRLSSSRGDLHKADQQLFGAIIELPEGLSQFERLPYRLQEVSLLTAQARIAAATALAEELHAACAGIDPQPAILTSILNALGQLALIQGDWGKALSFYDRSLSIATELNLLSTRALALSGIARCKTAQSDPQSAAELVEEALSIVRRTELRLFEHSLLLQEADLLAKTAKDDANDAFDRMSRLLMAGYRLESVPLDLQANLALGLLCWHETREPEKALSYFEESASAAERGGLVLIELLGKGLLGSLWQDLGDSARAEDLLSEVLARLEALELRLPAGKGFRERYRDLTGFPF